MPPLSLLTRVFTVIGYWLISAAAQAKEVPSLASEVTRESIERSLNRGVKFLRTHQNRDGSWGSATLTKNLNIYGPVPGAHHAFRAGATSLALAGFIDAGDTSHANATIEKAAIWISKELPKLRRADQTTTYNVWGHAYGLRAISRLHQREPDATRKLEWVKLAQQQVDLVNRYDDINGGWGYLDIFDELATQKPSGIPTSFTTATLLLAMDEARRNMGVNLDERLLKNAIAGINYQRAPDFSYAYSFRHRMAPRVDINRPAGSLARSQACNAALIAFGEKEVTEQVLRDWADRFLAREGFLNNARKRPVPHEGQFRIAGYFYYYGTYYFTESVRRLPPAEQSAYAERLAALLLKRQESDGSWWDFPLYNYHQAYGTGYALMALSWCRNVLDLPKMPETN